MRASTRDARAVTPRASLAVDVARWTLSVPTMYAMVSINEYPITFPQTAFTGWKHSGIGIEQSKDALRFYTKVKNVNVKL